MNAACPLVGIVIVNWNGKEYMSKCLDAVLNQGYRHYRIAVVDNGSQDGSPGIIRAGYPAADIISFDENKGFAAGTNAGIRHLFSDERIKYIFTLNNDAVLSRGCLSALVDAAEKHPDFDMFACRMLSGSRPDEIYSLGIGISRDCMPSDIKKCGFEGKPAEVFGPCAGAALYRRFLLEKTGLFDELFFAGLEDVDLAWRARLSGSKCLLVRDAEVMHEGSATSKREPLMKLYHLHKNRFLLLMKYYPLWLVAVNCFSIFYPDGKNIGRLRLPASYFNKYPKIPQALIYLKACLASFGFIPKMLSERRKLSLIRKAGRGQIESWFGSRVREIT